MMISRCGLLPIEQRDNDGELIEAIGDLVCQKDFTLVRRCEGLTLDVSKAQMDRRRSGTIPIRQRVDLPPCRLRLVPSFSCEKPLAGELIVEMMHEFGITVEEPRWNADVGS